MISLLSRILRRRQPELRDARGQVCLVRDPSNLGAAARSHRLTFTRKIDQPLLLISQIQRSGGTLLSQLFDGHPQLYAHPHELKIGRPDKYYWPDLDLSQPPAQWFDSLKEDDVVRHAQYGYRKVPKRQSEDHEPLPFIFSQVLQREIFLLAAERQRPTTQREVLNCYVTSYFNAWIDYQALYRPAGEVRFWSAFVPRLPMNEENCRRLFRDYPEGRLIGIIRDPVSWYASASRHDPKQYGDPEKAASLWLASTRGCLRNQKEYGERVVLIRFEDLVGDTAKTMVDLCRRIGIRFDDSLLTATFNGMPIQADTSFSSPRAGKILPSSADRSQHVSQDDAAYIRQATAECVEEVRQALAGGPAPG